jgi:hypothetical protein
LCEGGALKADEKNECRPKCVLHAFTLSSKRQKTQDLLVRSFNRFVNDFRHLLSRQKIDNPLK